MLTFGYLWQLEQGTRAPRGEVARALIEALDLPPHVAAELEEIGDAVDHDREARAQLRAEGATR